MLTFVKKADPTEYSFHKLAFRVRPDAVPEPLSHEHGFLTMRQIRGSSVADLFGEEAKHVPEQVWESMRQIVKSLYAYGICYNDITGYNFMIEDDTAKLFIVDFEHCTDVSFTQRFLDGHDGWNPDFA